MQGQFSTTKSLFDLLVAVGSFGFPQSVILAINKDKTSRLQLYKNGITYSIFAYIFFIIIVVGLSYWVNIELYEYFILGMGAACLVLYNIIRGVLLTIDDGFVFNIVTVAPAVFLSATVGLYFIWMLEVEFVYLVWAFLISSVMTLILSVRIICGKNINSYIGVAPSYRKLIVNGMDVFVQSGAMSMQTYLFFMFINKYNSNVEAGYFGIALTIYQACLLPLQMVSPMFINTLSKQGEGVSLVYAQHTEKRIFIILIGFVSVGVLIIPFVIDFLMGEQYKSAIMATQICLLAVIPGVAIRVTALRLASIGFFRINAFAAILRLCIAIFTLFCISNSGLNYLNGSIVAAISLFASELIGALFSKYFLSRKIIMINSKNRGRV